MVALEVVAHKIQSVQAKAEVDVAPFSPWVIYISDMKLYTPEIIASTGKQQGPQLVQHSCTWPMALAWATVEQLTPIQKKGVGKNNFKLTWK